MIGVSIGEAILIALIVVLLVKVVAR